jgi:cell division protein FtsB
VNRILKDLRRYGLVWGVLLLFIVIFSALAVREGRQWWTLYRELHQVEDETSAVRNRTEELARSLRTLQSPEYLEREARARLNVKKEGEEVFVVVGLEQLKKEEQFGRAPIEERSKVWENVKSWWRYFFK